MPVANKSLETIRCRGNTNRESAYGDGGENLIGCGIDHSSRIGVSRGDKKIRGRRSLVCEGKGENNQQQREAICFHR